MLLRGNIMTYIQAVSKRIKELCKKRGLTINHLSNLSGLRPRKSIF